MKIIYGGIRELFRYLLAYLSSLSIILYILFSAINIILPKDNYDKINDIFLQNVDSKINNGGEKIIGYYQENKAGVYGESFDLKGILNPGKYKHSIFAMLIHEKIKDNTNQFLQNGEIVNSQQNIMEESKSTESLKGNPFDIDKIITDLNLPKEKKVAVIAKELGIDWKKEKGDYAKLAGIEGKYVGSLEQNQRIRTYLINNAKEIYKDKHGRNEWDTLPLVAKENEIIKLNTKEITGQLTYNNVTLKVTAPTGSFPEGSILKIKTLEDEDFIAKLNITLGEVALINQVEDIKLDAPMVSFDISFYAPNDTNFTEKLQPAEGKYVSVVFDYADNNEFQNSEDEGFLAVYHMEDYNDMSVASLVGLKNPRDIKNNTKSDFIDIYANALSVYILTIVSDLNEDTPESGNTITFDTGTGGFIVTDNEFLYSTGACNESIYTGEILSTNDTITLPDAKFTGYTFGGRYIGNTFLGYAGDIIKLGNSNDSKLEQSDIYIEDNNGNYKIYACFYRENIDSNICNLNINSNLNAFKESLDDITPHNIDVYIPSDEEIKKYGKEVFDAYNWAIINGIITIDDINSDKLNAEVTRAELAKMMVTFMSGVLQKEPIIDDGVSYTDVNKKKLGDLAGYIELAYQYQIMGINADGSPKDKFNPNKPVSRGQFASVLSRILFGNAYNQSGIDYYEKHIQTLNNANIMNDTDHSLTECQWWIVVMLYRAYNDIANN